MKELIDEALQLINDRPQDCILIHDVLKNWDEEMKAAFLLAYRIGIEDFQDEH
jgi:hypothetical protein